MKKYLIFSICAGLIIQNSYPKMGGMISNPQESDQLKESLKGEAIQNIDLSGKNLNGFDLTKKKFKNVKFVNAHLENTILKGAEFTDCDFSGAFLKNSDLTGIVFKTGSLRKAQIQGANLTGAFIATEVILKDLQIVDGINQSNIGIWFTRAQNPIDTLKLQKSLSKQVDHNKEQNVKDYFQKAANLLSDLIAAMRFNFSFCDLSGQDCREFCFRNARFYGTNFKKTRLRNADFRGAELSGMQMETVTYNFFTGYKSPGFYMENVRLTDTIWLPNKKMKIIDLQNLAYSYLKQGNSRISSMIEAIIKAKNPDNVADVD